ncbi:MAG: chromosome segregation protein SMC [Verrucomicrobiales bacterium]
MVLKSLLLQGFKSFADKTVIDFHDGVTGIVGPNGCGKSNIVDAIKWVLGETSAKALRGGEMADVIFNGTDKRQPHNFAEVTLTFSGCEKALNVDYHEISITRRVHRDGKGEYALNGTPCRLRDINGLFMDTGIGQSAYSIMEQGKIDQLLSSKPEDRRAVFEEAAGITKFKTQKREAIRKLEYTDANLLRVTDIVAELKRQIASMQRQAAKARRYQEVHRDARVLDTHWAHHRFTEWSAEQGELNTSVASLNREIERMGEELAAREDEVDSLRRELERTDAQLAALRATISEHQTRRHSAEGRIGFNGERVRELESLIAKSQEEIEATRLRLAEETHSLEEADETLVQVTDKISTQESAIAEQTARTQHQREAREALERELRELRRLAHQAETAIISQQAQLSNNQSQIDGDQRRHEQLTAEAAKLASDRDERAKEEQRILAEHAVVASQRTAQQAEFAEMQERLRQTQTELDLVHKTEREVHRYLAEKQSRLQVLEQLLDRGEGLEKGTQQVLAGLNQPQLYRGGIRGLLSSYLEVEPDYIRAIEAALGQHLQTVLIADELLAESLIETLTRERLGEAVLLPESFLPVELPRQLSILPEGSQAWAADKVRVRPPVGPLIDHLLGNVLIVPDLASALRLRSQYPDIAFATQSGEFVSAQGLIRGGRSTEEPTSMLQRQNEIRSLQSEVQSGTERHATMESTVAALSGLVTGLRDQLAEAAHALHATKLRESELQGQLQLVRKEIDAHGHRIQALESEAAHIATRRDELTATLAMVTERITTARLEVEAHGLRAAELDQAVADATRAESQNAESLNDLKRSLALERQAAESLRTQRDPMLGRLRELESLITRRESEITAHQQRIANAHEETDALHVTIAECQSEITALDESIAAGQAQRAELSQKLGEIERSLTGARRQLAAWSEQRGREEVKATQLSLRLENLVASVSERYQTSLEAFEADYHTLCLTLAAVRARRATQEKRRASLAGESAPEAPTGEPNSLAHPASEAIGPDVSAGPEFDTFIDPAPGAPVIPWDEVELFATELRQRLDAMGPVNLDAIQEYEELEERYTFLEKEHGDLTASKAELLNIIQKINVETKRMFAETFEQIRLNFGRTFKELFGPQAYANLVLTDGDDPLESGIDVIAKPPGKKPTTITLLSGGERSMTAVALLFSIYMVKPSPFCVLDELDAPLDESNIGRFLNMLDQFIDKSQFVIVTHNKKTMRRADVMYGITMEEFGVSKPVGVKLTAEERAEPNSKRSQAIEPAAREPDAMESPPADAPTAETAP